MQPFSGYFQIGYSGTKQRQQTHENGGKMYFFDHVKFFFNLDF